MEPEPQNMFPETIESTPVQNGMPYFMGDNALIRFSSGEGANEPQTHWLVDKSNHTIRPFESENALKKAFGPGYQQAIQNIVTVISPNISQDGEIMDGVLQDFSILGTEYSVKDDGTSKKLRFSPHQLRQRYGKPIDENSEGLAAEALEGLFRVLKTKENETKIPASFLEQIKKDSQLMAFYISALAYGKYFLSDIYTDILSRFQNSKE